MTTDYRALCAELLEAWDDLPWEYDFKGNPVGPLAELDDTPFDRARAALAQPEPEVPTDDELLGVMLKAADSVPGGQCTGILDWDQEAVAAARAVLARWGRPAITPVPVSERLPGAEDCDAEGRCWYWDPEEDNEHWDFMPKVSGNTTTWTHWLPFHALPLPGQPATDAPA